MNIAKIKATETLAPQRRVSRLSQSAIVNMHDCTFHPLSEATGWLTSHRSRFTSRCIQPWICCSVSRLSEQADTSRLRLTLSASLARAASRCGRFDLAALREKREVYISHPENLRCLPIPVSNRACVDACGGLGQRRHHADALGCATDRRTETPRTRALRDRGTPISSSRDHSLRENTKCHNSLL